MDSKTFVPVPPARQKELVERCLRSNSYSALSDISCDCLNGVVLLRGCLPTYYLKQVAQVVVAHLEGVEQIDNQIEVGSLSAVAEYVSS